MNSARRRILKIALGAVAWTIGLVMLIGGIALYNTSLLGDLSAGLLTWVGALLAITGMGVTLVQVILAWHELRDS